MIQFLARHREKGFTLIELLVVIAIIGVLASVVLASLNNAREKSRDARRITDVKQIQLALELFFDSAQGASQYPTAVATGCAHSGTGSGNAGGLEVLQTNGHLPTVPRDPLSSTAAAICYSYATPATPITTYHLGASLEDTGNPAFNGDRDCNSDAAGCGTAAYTGGFSGADNNSCPAADDATRGCYDLIP